MSDTHFYALKVKAVNPVLSDSVNLVFDIPAELKDKFHYEHGQYLTLKFDLKGQEVRRAYSLCTSPVVDADPAVTVKRVHKGLVSNHINDTIKAGDTIEVMPPQGRFTVALNPDNKKDYFLFGSGSGITPLLSILKTVLEVEPKSRVCLLYGNRNEDSILFEQELNQLLQRYAGQLVVEHTLSQPKQEKAGGLTGLFKKPKINWTGAVGRIDGRKAAEFVDKNAMGDGRPQEHFLCGPSAMMEAVELMLKGKGLDSKNVHAEWFTNAGETKAAGAAVGASALSNATVTVIISGKRHEVSLQGKESILDAMRRLQLDPPYSCLSGACATCMAKVTEGSVAMDACFALDDDEIKKGFVLSCQARPTSEGVVVSFDI